MVLGSTIAMPTMAWLIAERGFNVARASRLGSVQHGSAHTAVELSDHQDIRRPSGLSRSIPAAR